MKVAHIYLSLHVLITTSVLVSAFDPVTSTVVVGAAAFLGGTIYYYSQESCSSSWISFNATREHAHPKSHKLPTLFQPM